MRKLTALLLAAATTLLTACGGGGTFDEIGGNGTKIPGNPTMNITGALPSASVASIVSGFTF